MDSPFSRDYAQAREKFGAAAAVAGVAVQSVLLTKASRCARRRSAALP
jgi:hypothetical protein